MKCPNCGGEFDGQVCYHCGLALLPDQEPAFLPAEAGQGTTVEEDQASPRTLGGAHSLPALYLALDNPDPAVGQQALQELWHVTLGAALPQPRDFWWLVGLGLLLMNDPVVARASGETSAAQVLQEAVGLCKEWAGGKPPPRAWERLPQPRTEPLVRALAVWAMGQAKDAQAVNVLLPALQDATPAVRASAAEALGNIGPREAVESLCEALEDPEPEVRRQAALALGKIGDPAALPALQKKTKLWTLFIDEESVRAACRQAIAAIEKKAGDTLTLPRPVEGPEPATETLPRPAGTPEPSKETLPRPAGEE